ncbi:MAG TPA: LON peptidase substrate-binding domain-containing protein [Alphaproteobacteria bacterium]|nr:LON peptidase substrate-binding domain-containing protein [Alphaproteobacteria bacterium]
MSGSPFFPSFDELGATIPIFPLTGVVLLPRGLLPLNIFEPRYIEMVDDALATDRMIGMIQPVAPNDPADRPPVYGTGCAGRITSFDETEDGRYLITLTGICRFRVAGELPATTAYRRAEADWSGFAGDFDQPTIDLDRKRLCTVLTGYFRQHGISANWEAIRDTPDERLVTSLVMICPFGPSEKQALLEAPTLAERAEMMISLIEMAVLGRETDDGACH